MVVPSILVAIPAKYSSASIAVTASIARESRIGFPALRDSSSASFGPWLSTSWASFERVGIKVEDAFRGHNPFRPAAVELVLAASLLAGMRDEVDLLDQAPLVVRSKKNVGVAHAY